MAIDPRFLEMEWQNGFESTLDDRVVLSDEYIPMTPVPEGNFGRLVLEDTSKENFEVIRYNRKDAGGVYVETADGGLRNEDGHSSGVHPRGARVRGNITAQDFRAVQAAVQEVENLSPIAFADDAFGDGVVSGLSITYPATGRVADISAGVSYMGGRRVTTAAGSRTYTATKDTYIILSELGALSYQEVTVGAAAPTPPANAIIIGMITTDATKITAMKQFNRGVVKADKIDFATLTPTGVVDANGWTVYDYGFKKVAKKVTTNTETKVRFEISSRSSNLPVGITTYGKFVDVRASIGNGTYSDFATITRLNSLPASTTIGVIYMFLGPTSATAYTIPIEMTVEWLVP